jgi:hypothetical protein
MGFGVRSIKLLDSNTVEFNYCVTVNISTISIVFIV